MDKFLKVDDRFIAKIWIFWLCLVIVAKIQDCFTFGVNREN